MSADELVVDTTYLPLQDDGLKPTGEYQGLNMK